MCSANLRIILQHKKFLRCKTCAAPSLSPNRLLFFRSLVPPKRALFPSPTSRTSHSRPPLFVPRLQTFLKFPSHSYPPKDQNIIGSQKNLQRFSKNLQRFWKNLQRFSENLQRFSENLQRFSENLQRFSRKLQHFSRKLQRNEPTTPFSSLTSKV